MVIRAPERRNAQGCGKTFNIEPVFADVTMRPGESGHDFNYSIDTKEATWWQNYFDAMTLT
jgi:hypothetical protein